MTEQHTHQRRTRKLGARVRSGLGACVLAGGLLATLGANQDSNVAEVTRELVRKRMAVQRMIWSEKRDWELAKDVLESQIALRQQEIEGLRGQVGKAEGEIGEADSKIGKLTAAGDAAEAVSQSLRAQVEVLEARTKELLVRLPEYVREKVRPLSQQFPEKPQQTEQGVAVRYANLAAVLNEIIKANAEIHLTSEVHKLEDGRSAEVSAFYVGLSQAYYVTATGDAAAVGTSTAEGWEWTPNLEAANPISLAIDILNNEEPATFVRLPVTID